MTDPGELVELEPVPPILGPAVAEAVNGRATFHIIGGMQVSGRVVEYDPALGIVTVRDSGDRNFEIDVRCVAVLET